MAELLWEFWYWNEGVEAWQQIGVPAYSAYMAGEDIKWRVSEGYEVQIDFHHHIELSKGDVRVQWRMVVKGESDGPAHD